MTDFTFPLSPATVHDGSITVSMFVQEPTRVSNYIANVIQANLLSQFLFTSTEAKGGAIMYDQLVKNQATAANKPGVIAPGGEFPLIGTSEGKPQVDPVIKTGGKFEITREAQKRNDPILLQRGSQRVANTMAIDIDGRGFQVINDTLASISGSLKVESSGWAAAGKVKASEKTAVAGEGTLINDLEEGKLKIKETQLGYIADTLVLRSRDAKNLRTILGVKNWKEILDTLGLTLYETDSDKLAEGDGLLLQCGAVGVMGVEDPISTDNEYVKGQQKTVFYTWASMAFGVTDPFSVVRLTGLAQ
ncbi:major capsid protein [Corynebacterium cystitidis]|uniref:major capsid protein n=1 Tax=Corynebacterium cystitidis TaxID=35757 RepID=UPI00211EAB12|nr:major capsid protein [Corynebacterium cystitidis]